MISGEKNVLKWQKWENMGKGGNVMMRVII